MKLYGISDLHLSSRRARAALEVLPDHQPDWLILAGDIAERCDDLDWALELLSARFAKLLWVPGNHDLWSETGESDQAPLRGQAKYQRLVAICRAHGVLTPEDPYTLWPGAPHPHQLVPLFLLYDYSFGPPGATPIETLAWAEQAEVVCADERCLSPHPYPTREAWCSARLAQSRARLEAELDPTLPTILINHWPLRADLLLLPTIPRFAPWCGTEATAQWHLRYRASCVVYGHLHVRRTHYRDGVRFEEVSLGYHRQYDPKPGIAGYLRQILPHPSGPLRLQRHP